MMLIYGAKVVPDGKVWTVSFPDIPEALTGADTKEQAIEMAHDALLTAMDFYFEDGRAVPMPSPLSDDLVPVFVPTSQSAKVLLLNEMVKQRVRPSELADRLKDSKQSVHRLLQLRHSSKIDGIEQALGALGKRLELRVA